MMAEQIKTRMTAAEFQQLPETNLPLQLLNGEVIEMNASALPHQDVVGNTFVLFKLKIKEFGGKAYVAPVDVYFDELNMPQPDVIWLAPDSRCQMVGTERLSGAPDLIAEVLSPSTAHIDRKEKFHLYEKHGVREYWLIDPRDELIEVWQHQGEGFVRLELFGVGETFMSALIGHVEVAALFAR
ncbi:MAG: Uma2 family endonuclease [Anaerolineaceae bacterium]|nr:Uma2 family endonuclease [Anaerolineaceae bacterium]